MNIEDMTEEELNEVARQERNRYIREYRAAHKEKVKEYNARYWARRAAKRKAEEAER